LLLYVVSDNFKSNHHHWSQQLFHACQRVEPSVEEIRDLVARVPHLTLPCPPCLVLTEEGIHHHDTTVLHVLAQHPAATTVAVMDVLLRTFSSPQPGIIIECNDDTHYYHEEENDDDPLLAKDATGQTPLHVAVRSFVRLTQATASSLAMTSSQLHESFRARSHALALIQYLVMRCPEAAAVRDYGPLSTGSGPAMGETPLHVAATAAELPVVEWIVQVCPQAVHVRDTALGRLPIHRLLQACSTRTDIDIPTKVFPVLRCLVHAWPDSLLETDLIGKVPLHTACESQLPHDMIQYLVDERPESVWRKDATGSLPLQYWKANTAYCLQQEASIRHMLTRQGSQKRRPSACGSSPGGRRASWTPPRPRPRRQTNSLSPTPPPMPVLAPTTTWSPTNTSPLVRHQPSSSSTTTSSPSPSPSPTSFTSSSPTPPPATAEGPTPQPPIKGQKAF
jgi:hypothetical protein